MKKKILILGGTGMLGHVLFRYFAQNGGYEVYATSRNFLEAASHFPPELAARLRRGNVDADNFDTVIRALASIQPDIVINCIGAIKQLPTAKDPLTAITVNAQLPHRISLVSRAADARMIHISTDCVFDGKRGMYTEADIPSPEDLYGRTKLLGEVSYPHCVTLRTSIIGHELRGRRGLIEWFLGESVKVRGYKNAIYSGFPTIALAKIILNYVLPDKQMRGVYHVSSKPISKYDLLKLVAEKYGKEIDIEPYEDFVEDRSLISERFYRQTGYTPPEWPDLIDAMHKDFEANREQYGR